LLAERRIHSYQRILYRQLQTKTEEGV